MHGSIRSLGALGLLLAAIAGCTARTSGPEVVVYTALDQEFSQPVFEDFKRESGISVLAKYDTESTKTVGLTNALIEEKARPRCDVFWNNEILNTLRLERQGLLTPYRSPTDENFPAMYRSPTGAWHAFAARARVLIVNTEALQGANPPHSIRDLAAEQWRGRVGIAKPLFGTTATHAACLFAVWGDAKAEEFFQSLRDKQVKIMGGNSDVARAVGAGQLVFGLTDTDDAIAERDKGMPVTIIYPDQGPNELGTLFIPNTVSIIRNCPHPPAAQRMIDYVLSPFVEEQLAKGASAQIPLSSAATEKSRLNIPPDIRQMQVDFGAAADSWDTAAKFLREKFSAP